MDGQQGIVSIIRSRYGSEKIIRKHMVGIPKLKFPLNNDISENSHILDGHTLPTRIRTKGYKKPFFEMACI